MGGSASMGGVGVKRENAGSAWDREVGRDICHCICGSSDDIWVSSTGASGSSYFLCQTRWTHHTSSIIHRLLTLGALASGQEAGGRGTRTGPGIRPGPLPTLGGSFSGGDRGCRPSVGTLAFLVGTGGVGATGRGSVAGLLLLRLLIAIGAATVVTVVASGGAIEGMLHQIQRERERSK